MKITWLGQAGLLFEQFGFNIMIDPYFSDSVTEIEPHNFRRVPVDQRFFSVRPDVLIITHKHRDHLDKRTLDVFFSRYDGITVLAPSDSIEEFYGYGIKNNYVMFNPGTRWTMNGIAFKSVKAEHSDLRAIGAVIKADRNYYVTGDTLYNDDVIAAAKKESPDIVFLPVNGVGNNMNMTDAAAFARELGSITAVPLHVGLFDNLSGNDMPYENKIVPEFYKEIKL